MIDIVMETDLGRIKKLSLDKEDENWGFRSFLKGCDIPSEKIDSIVQKLYQKISAEIDCKTCANCCKEIEPVLDREDIQKLSKGLGISAVQFKDQYLVKDTLVQERFKRKMIENVLLLGHRGLSETNETPKPGGQVHGTLCKPV